MTERHECSANRHGTLTAVIDHGCRCPDAVALRNKNASRNKTLRLLGRPQLVPAIGSQRRVRALMALGWRARDIAQRIGWLSGELDTLFRRKSVYRDTADRIRVVYDDLANRPGPSEQTRRRARRAGYLPPLWWDDDTIDDPLFIHPGTQAGDNRVDPVVIERLIDGQPPLNVTRAERAAAVLELHRRDRTISQIAVQLHMSGGRIAQILAGTVRSATHTPAESNRQESA